MEHNEKSLAKFNYVHSGNAAEECSSSGNVGPLQDYNLSKQQITPKDGKDMNNHHTNQDHKMAGPTNEVIKFRNCHLYAPNPKFPMFTTRSKPLGCSVVSVGGLPEKASEDIIKEVFEACGEVENIRMSKNTWFVHFASDESVENAIRFSGYTIKIENKDDKAFAGKLQVDYAQSSDDAFEHQTLQLEDCNFVEDYCKSAPFASFSDDEATVSNKSQEESFKKSMLDLSSRLERGELNKENVEAYFLMVQSFFEQFNRRVECHDELNRAKLMLDQKVKNIQGQFQDINRVFNAACSSEVLDCFTEPQKIKVQLWKDQEELANAYNCMVKEQGGTGKTWTKSDMEMLNKLRQEKQDLESRIAATKMEIKVIKKKAKQKILMKDCIIDALKDSLRMVQEASGIDPSTEAELHETENLSLDSAEDHSEMNNLGSGSSISSGPSVRTMTEVDLIAFLSVILDKCPFGAPLDVIWYHVHQINPAIQPRDVQNLLEKYSVFREDNKFWKLIRHPE